MIVTTADPVDLARLVETQPTVELERQLAVVERAIELARRGGTELPSVLLADRSHFEHELDLARERDERLADRHRLGKAYAECWCLGSGGRHLVGLAVRTAEGRLASSGQTVYAETCSCPEGRAHDRVKAEARKALYQEIEQRVSRRLVTEARVPQRYRAASLRGWSEAQLAAGAEPAIIEAIRSVLDEWWRNIHANAEDGGALACLLILSGEYGEGKTSLAVAALRRWLEEGGSGLLWSAQELLEEVRSRFGGDGAAGTILAAKRAPLLVIDDLGAEALSEKTASWAVPLLLDILSYRQSHCLPTAITTNLTTSELADRLGGRLAERVLAEGISVLADFAGTRNLRGSRW